MKYCVVCLLFSVLLITSCEKNQIQPDRQMLIVPTLAPDYSKASGNLPISGISQNDFKDRNQAIHLGRVLFYDKALSAGNTVSCGSCHRQEFAFADPFRHSTGIGSQLSERNTPTIINSGFGNGLFWDQRAANLLNLVTRPIANHREMGFANIDELLTKLESITYYPELFQLAYGTSEVTEKRLSVALALFIGKLNSFDADLDLSGINGGAELSELEKRGMGLFVDHQCNSCHHVINSGSANSFDENFSSQGYTGFASRGEVANIGLDQVYTDQGVSAISGQSINDGQFKIPSLRNVAITPPYMHDGRFATLHDVLTFYSDNIRPHVNLDFRLQDAEGKPVRMHLSETDKEALIAFLGTLTSKDILTNELFSSPFE